MRIPDRFAVSLLRAARGIGQYLIQNVDNWGYQGVFGALEGCYDHCSGKYAHALIHDF